MPTTTFSSHLPETPKRDFNLPETLQLIWSSARRLPYLLQTQKGDFLTCLYLNKQTLPHAWNLTRTLLDLPRTPQGDCTVPETQQEDFLTCLKVAEELSQVPKI